MSKKIHKKVTLPEGVLNWTMQTSRKVSNGKFATFNEELLSGLQQLEKTNPHMYVMVLNALGFQSFQQSFPIAHGFNVAGLKAVQ